MLGGASEVSHFTPLNPSRPPTHTAEHFPLAQVWRGPRWTGRCSLEHRRQRQLPPPEGSSASAIPTRRLSSRAKCPEPAASKILDKAPAGAPMSRQLQPGT